MLDFEGNISELSWRSKHQVVFKEEDNETTDLAYSIASAPSSDWEVNINAKLSSAFTMSLCVEHH